MSSRHRLATVLLLVLIGLPVGGTLCGMVCNAAPAQAAHHGSGQECEEAAPRSSGPQLTDVSQHDCGKHDATIQSVATAAAKRMDLAARAAPSIPLTPHTELVDSESAFEYAAPPGTAPPTATPLVLRV